MKFSASKHLPDVIIVEPEVFTDTRGTFQETYNSLNYAVRNVPHTFVQDNMSYSLKNVIRGIHFQTTKPQGKLVYALSGEIFDVFVDIRVGSPTFGKWEGIILSSENHLQVYVPEGFAHGFCVISDTAQIAYKCTDYYYPPGERGIIWNDPALNISWPAVNPNVSDKDRSYSTLDMIQKKDLPVY